MAKIRISDEVIEVDDRVATHIQGLEQRVVDGIADGKKEFSERIKLLKIDDSLDMNEDLVTIKRNLIRKKGYKVSDEANDNYLNGMIDIIKDITVTKTTIADSKPNNGGWDDLKKIMKGR